MLDGLCLYILQKIGPSDVQFGPRDQSGSTRSVFSHFGPQKRAEVTEDQNDQGPKWMYTLESLHLSVNL